MVTNKKDSLWASKVEPEAQRLRRLVSGAENCVLPTSPTLLPLGSLDDGAAPHTLFQAPLARITHGDTVRPHMLDSTPEKQPQFSHSAVLPSVSSLNRELNSLCLLFADLDCGGDRGEVAPRVRLSESTLNARDERRQKSAPGAPRDSSRRIDRLSTPLHHSTASELTDLLEAPPLPGVRKVSTSPLQPALDPQPLSSAPHAKAPRAGTRMSASLDSSSAPPPLVKVTSCETRERLCVGSSALGGKSPPPSPRGYPHLSPRAGPGCENGALASGPSARKPANGVTAKLPAQTPTVPVAVREPSVTNGRGKSRGGRITVVVRKRPMAPGDPGVDCVQVHKEHVRIAATKQRVDLTTYEENSDYTFDSVFGEEATNHIVYTHSVRDLLDVSLSGGSTSCFAYGQTGSGKTHTMIGTETEKGVYLQAAAELLERMLPGQQLAVSFFEIYCNSLYDLLNSRHPIVLREDANRRVNICGIVWRTVTALEELKELVQSGMEQRRTGATTANEHSSRSHAVLSLRIEDSTHSDPKGIINFVDLAGSERAADTAALDRITRLEGAEINKSLLALKECIRALDEKKRHVPFRGSRLTEVLRDSFTGNCKTVMIAAVSPSSVDHEHTNNTLRYAFRVKGLSIPSVEPSKARNAPRVYQPVARSRPIVGGVPTTNSPHLIPALQGCDVDSKPMNDVESRWKSRRARRRRHDYKKAHRLCGEMDMADPLADIIATDISTEPRSQETPRTPAHWTRCSSRESSSSTGRQKTRASAHGTAETVSRCRAKRRTSNSCAPPLHAVLSSCASSDFSLKPVRDVDTKSRSPAEGALPGVKGATPSPSTNTSLGATALEQRLTQQIIAQLRIDLGQQLEEVLTQKDAMILSLERENEQLRHALDKARGTEARQPPTGYDSPAEP
ncbi:hypothetical protein JKF63_03769 [Porcisia hertigi]|uniref:Kinesin motor domain-containing protein n=1 Tax=Porcisia hertigi TaxID=2761500 RepID=A0A836I6B4_9TRYP|nr:hypothetical protein JKF63_03769 [Porcisia hertigi]